MSDGTMFAGDHPQSGDWATLKGRMLAPHEEPPLAGTNEGPERLNQEASGGYNWEDSLRAVDAPTRGGGTLAH